MNFFNVVATVLVNTLILYNDSTVNGQQNNITRFQQEFVNVTNVQVPVNASHTATLSLNCTRTCVSNTTDYNITLQWNKIGGSRETLNNLQQLSIKNCTAHGNFSNDEWPCTIRLEQFSNVTDAFEQNNNRKSNTTNQFNTTTTSEIDVATGDPPNGPDRMTNITIGTGIVLLVMVVAGLMYSFVCRRIESVSFVACHIRNP